MIITRTPYRVSLFGGGSDYPEHFNEHGGAVLGMAINKYAYIGVKRMPPGQGPRFRVVYSKIEDVMEVDQIQHPAVRGCLKFLSIDEPTEITYSGDLASGGGLGASSAFVVGLINALQTQYRSSINGTLVDDAIFVERKVIGEAVGYQDQIMTTLGGIQFIEFAEEDDWQTTAIKPSPARVKELEDSLVLIYSGSMRFAHIMAAKQLTRVRQNYGLLNSMSSLAAVARDLLLDENEPLSTIGKYLDMSWAMKRGLHPEISTPSIDRLYAHGLSLGALGGKLCGAGGGGFLLFFVPPDLRLNFEQHIGATCVGFKVAPVGSHILVNEP